MKQLEDVTKKYGMSLNDGETITVDGVTYMRAGDKIYRLVPKE